MLPYNPYAKQQEEPLKPGETKPWPPFYKPPQLSAAELHRYAMGWCRWRPGKYKYDPTSLIMVSNLPEDTFKTRVVSLGQGYVVTVDEKGRQVLVLIHPDKDVSRINVHGEAEPAILQKNMFVRFRSKVDAAGRTLDDVARLEVFTPGANTRYNEVVPNTLQTIMGKVINLRGDVVQVLLPSGRVRRVTLTLAKNAEISVNTPNYQLASPGDEVTVRGKVYQQAIPSNKTDVFAVELDISLSDKPAAASGGYASPRGFLVVSS